MSFREIFYFDLPAFFAQASLQYFDLALKVVYGFLHTGHFFSIVNPATYTTIIIISLGEI